MDLSGVRANARWTRWTPRDIGRWGPVKGKVAHKGREGASGSGNGVNFSESWEREFYMYRRGTFESLGTRLFGNQACKRGEEEQRGHLD